MVLHTVPVTAGHNQGDIPAMSKTIQAGRWTLLAAALAVFAFTACSLGGDIDAWRAKAAGKENDGGTEIHYTVSPDSTTNTTAINFYFSASVSGLSASQISVSGGTGSVTRGTFTGSGTSWTLPITVNTAGTIYVSISKSGVESGTKTLSVHRNVTYTVTPNSTSSTTALNFNFSASVSGLNASEINISNGIPAGSLTKGTPTGSGTSWTLPVTVSTAGTVNVSISKSGIESGAKTVNVYKLSDSSLISYTVSPDSTTNTTALNFTFSAGVSGLTASQISLSDGSGSLTKGMPTGSGTSWTLPVTVNTAGTIYVSISKSGVESGAKTVNVYTSVYSVTLLDNAPYGWQYPYGLEEAYTGTKTNKGDIFTFTYSFKSNVFIDKLQLVLVDCDEPDYVWKTLSGYIPIGENIQPNTQITGSISIIATGTAASASFLANRLVIETTYGTSSQPTLTFTAIDLVKTSSAVTVTGGSLAAKLSWLQANAASNSSYILTASAGESIAPQNLGWSGKNNITVFLQGDNTARTISLSAQGAMFTVGSGLTLILDSNITLQGRSDNTASVLKVQSGGTLVMNTGVKITGNTNAYDNGGGAHIFSGGIFTMNGGEISGNTSAYWGGGLRNSGGTFIMNGGTISGNTADYGGGVDFEGTFTMSGGIISGNTASQSGGGVYQDSGTFRMNGGTIYGSSASSTLRNTAGYGWAALVTDSGTAEYGLYTGDMFIPSGALSTTDNTLRVENGNLYNN
jgi:hypothetical protein